MTYDSIRENRHNLLYAGSLLPRCDGWLLQEVFLATHGEVTSFISIHGSDRLERGFVPDYRYSTVLVEYLDS